MAAVSEAAKHGKSHVSVLVTGGLGFVGSHTCLALLEAGLDVFVVDNLYNSKLDVLDKIQDIAGRAVGFRQCDLRDSIVLNDIFDDVRPSFVMHFAGLKSVSESIDHPLEYYDVNTAGTLNVLRAMANACCNRLVFSSSATVYGIPEYLPCDETHPTNPTNPYGRSKLACESIIKDWVSLGQSRSSVMLRYFNPVGAHESGLIGEAPQQAANNLMPVLLDVVSGRRDKLEIFGSDYDTPDGTGVRDFIHVMDVADAHCAAIAYLRKHVGVSTFNLGSGKGTSVLELLRAFEKVNDCTINTVLSPRRTGDIGEVWTSIGSAGSCLDFTPRRTIYDMCKDAYNFSVAE